MKHKLSFLKHYLKKKPLQKAVAYIIEKQKSKNLYVSYLIVNDSIFAYNNMMIYETNYEFEYLSGI
jgi:hypothetical protein